jgi:hypothetical protein
VTGRDGRSASLPPVDVEGDLPRLFFMFDGASRRSEAALTVADFVAGANCFLRIAASIQRLI